MTIRQRPVSPHLQVYKPEFTSASSIFHRITGVGLAAGTMLLVVWIVAASLEGSVFVQIQSFWSSALGIILLFAWSFALFYHLCNGIRHLFWSAGKGFELKTARNSAIATVLSAILLTGIAWVWSFFVTGVF